MAESGRMIGFYMDILNRYRQKHNVDLKYQELTDHVDVQTPRFEIQVIIDGREFPKAESRTKKEAKNEAARMAVEILMTESADICPYLAQRRCTQGLSTGNHVGLINTFTQKRGLKATYECCEGSDSRNRFQYKCKIEGNVYGFGEATSKQDAKQKAAKMAYEKLLEEQTPNRCSGRANPNQPQISMHSVGTSSSSDDGNHSGSQFLSSGSGSQSFGSCSGSCGSTFYSVSESGFSDRKDLSSSCDGSPSPSSRNHRDPPELPEGRTPDRISRTATSDSPYTKNKRFVEDFTDIEPIGNGAFGRVFKARHKVDDKIYAIKRVRYDDSKVEREVKALAKLRHPNIIVYHSCWCGVDDHLDEEGDLRSEVDCLFILMEYCGKNLEEWIYGRKGCALDKALALDFFEQIVTGVNFIHEQNFIHRDLKPSNIFLVDEKQIKIGDFGLVTILTNDSSRTTETGTPLYMSPEQHSSMNYGNGVDIYALGVIFIELTQFCKTHQEVIKMLDSIKERKFPAEFDIREKCLLEKLLSNDISERPSASKVLSTLKEWRNAAKKMHRTV
ncbi:interferon-induced, double-stranded RNA-activated protein kinase [Suncus etruscus]|uniref:interferon-induced, double-stranded RNA-activated protein kinase n=1 Tax=Suncus etruscus TaxID=109475 RepID=UPI0021105216|nr:interferon-induced, double-stranded RNA-activated protein kinase [Suncus etruscus]